MMKVFLDTNILLDYGEVRNEELWPLIKDMREGVELIYCNSFRGRRKTHTQRCNNSPRYKRGSRYVTFLRVSEKS